MNPQITKKKKKKRTFAFSTNLSTVSLIHLRFCEGSGKSSQAIFTKPFPQSAYLLIPASTGGFGVHRGPASSINLFFAMSSTNGRSSTATTTLLFLSTG